MRARQPLSMNLDDPDDRPYPAIWAARPEAGSIAVALPNTWITPIQACCDLMR
jgi:hypothetical protein